MTWFKVDDSFHSHPKVLATSPAALGLWVVAGAWCGANLTDGFVPDHALPRLLPGSGELAKELVSVGLWRRAKGGYRFHDWAVYNPDSASVIKERDAARERMRRLRAGRKEGENGRTKPEHVRKKSGTESRSESPVDNSDSHMIESESPGQGTNGSGEQQANVRDVFGRSSQPRPDPTRPLNTNGSVGRHLPPVEGARENDEDESLDMINSKIEGRIIELLAELTGRTVDRVHASTVRRQLLDDRPVRDPLAYVTAAIRGEPKRYLPANGAPWEAPAPKLPPKDPDAYDHGAAEARKLLAEKLRKGTS